MSRASGRECWLAPGRLRVTLTEINKPKTSFVTYESATYSETIPQEDEMQVTHSHR
ncbi:MAG: hypothetical protein KDB22_01020 [Planctomycetales bacterium]|nr:hypothetical protein [Planctomycetales bacterium]